MIDRPNRDTRAGNAARLRLLERSREINRTGPRDKYLTSARDAAVKHIDESIRRIKDSA